MPNGSKWLTRLKEKTGPAEYCNQIMTEWAYEFGEFRNDE